MRERYKGIYCSIVRQASQTEEPEICGETPEDLDYLSPQGSPACGTKTITPGPVSPPLLDVQEFVPPLVHPGQGYGAEERQEAEGAGDDEGSGHLRVPASVTATVSVVGVSTTAIVLSQVSQHWLHHDKVERTAH